MTDYYVWHASAQDDSDANWNSSTLAYLDLDTCLAAVAAGSHVFVAHDHSKTYGADTTLNNSGTIASPVVVECVNRTTGARTNTAVEQTTGASFNLKWIENNIIYTGVNFKSGDFISGGINCTMIAEDCTLEFLSNASDFLSLGTGDLKVSLRNFTFKANNAGQYISVGGGVVFEWIGGGVDIGGTAITELLTDISDRNNTVFLKGLDLTNITTNIIEIPPTVSNGIWNVSMIGCKLPVGVPILDNTLFASPHTVIVHSCDTGDGYWYFEETYLEGQIVQATNVYLNATYDGSNGFSAKMVSNANALDAKRTLRFKLSEFYAAANPTLTVETITAGVTLQDDEFWLEIEYPNSTDEALRDIDDSSRQEVGWSGGSGPGTPSNLTSSSAGWTEDLAGEVKQKVAVTIASGAAGIHTVYACIAKPSTTVYVDPDVTVS